MPSPLPGMNPWLEWHWGDVHTRFVTYASDRLQPKLPADLRARVEERVAVEGLEKERQIRPDVRIYVKHRPRRPSRPLAGSEAALESEGGLAVAVEVEEIAEEPIIVQIPDEPITERFIEIKGIRGGPVITVIELLSPTNKQGGGKKLYETKRLQLLDAGISLVEIDLIRQGDRPWYVDAGWYADDEPYHVAVRYGWDISEMAIYPITLRQRLPTISVPLRYGEDPVLLSLQPVIDQCHDFGGYGEDIDYDEPPPGSPLDPDDLKWIHGLLNLPPVTPAPEEGGQTPTFPDKSKTHES